METRYENQLNQYKEIFQSGQNILANVCVARYEINLIKYKLTRDNQYILVLNAIEKILNTFIDLT